MLKDPAPGSIPRWRMFHGPALPPTVVVALSSDLGRRGAAGVQMAGAGRGGEGVECGGGVG